MSLTVAPETIEFFPQAELGEVEQTITSNRQGRIKFMATSWFARFYQPNGQRLALPGTPVRVIGRKGLTLLVVAIDDDVVQLQISSGNRSEVSQMGILRLVQQIGSVFANLLNLQS